MSHPEECDVVVLGSGAAGKLLAWTLAGQGNRTAVIERRYVGGTCPNVAGLPYTAPRDAVLTHPTMAEGLSVLFSSVPQG